MRPYKRIFTIVADSLGIGAMPNAAEYGDGGTDTLGHTDDHMPEFQIPNLVKLGLANLHPLTHVGAVERPMGYYGRLLEVSMGRGITTGYWEMMGLHITKSFQTFIDTGFLQELLDELSRRTGHRTVGNKPASDAEILNELTEYEIATGDMIIYAFTDSVPRICGNKEIFGLDKSYRCCEVVRELVMEDRWKIDRIIARPYVGEKEGEFKWTSNRHDYVLKPYGETALGALKENGYDMISVEKIKDIFDDEDITETYESKSSVYGMEQTLEVADKDFHGLCFANLVNFDALQGHRRSPEGHGQELERFNIKLGELLPKLRKDDLLLAIVDHGDDPTYKGTDHAKGVVSLLAYLPSMTEGGRPPDCDTFTVIGAIIADSFKVPMPEGAIGTSILKEPSQ